MFERPPTDRADCERGYHATPEDIRRAREQLMSRADDASVNRVIRIGDFFSTSGCRDLLFHVQGHQFTLPAIKEYLDRSNLQFIGFKLGARVRQQSRARFPEDPTMTDLHRWHIFERKIRRPSCDCANCGCSRLRADRSTFKAAAVGASHTHELRAGGLCTVDCPRYWPPVDSQGFLSTGVNAAALSQGATKRPRRPSLGRRLQAGCKLAAPGTQRANIANSVRSRAVIPFGGAPHTQQSSIA